MFFVNKNQQAIEQMLNRPDEGVIRLPGSELRFGSTLPQIRDERGLSWHPDYFLISCQPNALWIQAGVVSGGGGWYWKHNVYKTYNDLGIATLPELMAALSKYIPVVAKINYPAAAERIRMTKQQITRPALDLIENIEKDLSTFRGLRRLWANLAANDTLAMFTKPSDSIDPETLENEQLQALHSVVYFALCLHNELWPESEPFHVKYQRKASADKDSEKWQSLKRQIKKNMRYQKSCMNGKNDEANHLLHGHWQAGENILERMDEMEQERAED